MKLRDDFLTYPNGDKTVLVPVGRKAFSGVVKGNKTLGAILGLLKKETTEEAVIDAMKERFDAPENVIVRDVKKVIDELRKIGALDE